MSQDNMQGRPDSDNQAARVTAAADALTRQLERENEALKAGDFQLVNEMQADKSKLGRTFEEEFAALKRDFGDLLEEPENAPAALIRAVKDFHNALTENGRVLLRYKSISEGLVAAVTSEAAAQDPSVSRYGADAAIAAPDAPKAPPLALNQII